jgi:putative membrane protein
MRNLGPVFLLLNRRSCRVLLVLAALSLSLQSSNVPQGVEAFASPKLLRLSQQQRELQYERKGQLNFGPSDEDQIPYGEQSRRFRRTLFNHDDWTRHRHGDRLLKNLRTTLKSGVVRQLATELFLVTIVAIILCLWNSLLVTGYQDFLGKLHPPLSTSFPLLCLPLEPFSLSSPALGLLLVFRTNASYGRWTEARKAWGAVVNNCRTLLRLGASWVRDDDSGTSRKHLERLANATWAFARCLQRHMLGELEDEEAFLNDVHQHLSPATAQNLIDARHKPARALYDLSNVINALPLPYLRRLELDKSVVALCDALGVCDRIFSSPVPLVYTRHTARFLGFWTLALPLGLWKSFEASWNHCALLPACLLISFFLFGIEELATQLEEPFSILPIDSLVHGVRLGSDEAVEWHFDAESTKLRQSINHDVTVELFEHLMKSSNSDLL